MNGPLTSGPDSSTDERRRERRIRVRLPIEVRGTDCRGARFDERTSSADVCRQGVALALSREVELGASLEIVILLSRQPTQGQRDFSTQGLVRHIQKGETGPVIGVEFTGPYFRRVFLPETTGTA